MILFVLADQLGVALKKKNGKNIYIYRVYSVMSYLIVLI